MNIRFTLLWLYLRFSSYWCLKFENFLISKIEFLNFSETERVDKKSRLIYAREDYFKVEITWNEIVWITCVLLVKLTTVYRIYFLITKYQCNFGKLCNQSKMCNWTSKSNYNNIYAMENLASRENRRSLF